MADLNGMLTPTASLIQCVAELVGNSRAREVKAGPLAAVGCSVAVVYLFAVGASVIFRSNMWLTLAALHSASHRRRGGRAP